ncbi:MULTISPECIES: Crp/Fnr family transcriptional regulator [Roseateles]|uniref:Cyclic nucleotide-binding domain-containing protein n=1 Tax=Roseateles albus TaxID=2987525 RepID=A0ABT5KFH1_9BURK|nr:MULTISPECIES: cyclic nucleotide-binding domain-containing protein [Roseateles]MCV2359725.1 cyclic nucleotide-binding domain-containing protein [Paucibacter sp. TC2R-5]MDC8772672.1 cyclic nucleotide-binding domain-containing protein [Roseateles albus]
MNESISQLTEFAQAWLGDVLASPQQTLAHLAAAIAVALVMAGALARTMMPLRWLAAGSNVGLMIYGALHPSPITFSIAAVLLPVNLYRAIEVSKLTRRVHRAEADARQAGLWLKPYMKAKKLKAGQTLFSKGDLAEHLFLLVEGEMELVELGKVLEPGRIFGEIALFSPDRIRTSTVRCVTPCTVLRIHDSTVRQLYYQDHAFGFHLIDLLASRLSGDVQRAQAQLREAKREKLDQSQAHRQDSS